MMLSVLTDSLLLPLVSRVPVMSPPCLQPLTQIVGTCSPTWLESDLTALSISFDHSR